VSLSATSTTTSLYSEPNQLAASRQRDHDRQSFIDPTTGEWLPGVLGNTTVTKLLMEPWQHDLHGSVSMVNGLCSISGYDCVDWKKDCYDVVRTSEGSSHLRHDYNGNGSVLIAPRDVLNYSGMTTEQYILPSRLHDRYWWVLAFQNALPTLPSVLMPFIFDYFDD
jgi:hypothetical protein